MLMLAKKHRLCALIVMKRYHSKADIVVIVERRYKTKNLGGIRGFCFALNVVFSEVFSQRWGEEQGCDGECHKHNTHPQINVTIVAGIGCTV